MSIKQDFVRKALAKEGSFSSLCRHFNITRKTGYQILKKYEKEGLSGLAPNSRAPKNSPHKTNKEIEDKILEVRIKYPTWGARKITAYLKNQGVSSLPAFSTITEILKRHNMISIEESLKRKALIRFEREKPNDLWQMDFKGKFLLLTKQFCYPLTIIDDHSRFSICIKASANEQYLPVKQQLIRTFEKYGLPDQFNVDNGNPWGNSKLLPYTKLTIWLMQLGIRVTHSRPRHPQTNGKNERFHRTLKNDLISRYPMRSFLHAQKLFNKWRDIYNNIRPHEAIDMKVPADCYKQSQRRMPSTLPAIEYDGRAIVRKVRGNGYICYKNLEYLVGEAFVGHLIEIKDDECQKVLNLYFGPYQIYTYDY